MLDGELQAEATCSSETASERGEASQQMVQEDILAGVRALPIYVRPGGFAEQMRARALHERCARNTTSAEFMMAATVTPPITTASSSMRLAAIETDGWEAREIPRDSKHCCDGVGPSHIGIAAVVETSFTSTINLNAPTAALHSKKNAFTAVGKKGIPSLDVAPSVSTFVASDAKPSAHHVDPSKKTSGATSKRNIEIDDTQMLAKLGCHHPISSNSSCNTQWVNCEECDVTREIRNLSGAKNPAKYYDLGSSHIIRIHRSSKRPRESQADDAAVSNSGITVKVAKCERCTSIKDEADVNRWTTAHHGAGQGAEGGQDKIDNVRNKCTDDTAGAIITVPPPPDKKDTARTPAATSAYRGVSCKKRGKSESWVARIKTYVDGKPQQLYLGTFKDPVTAAHAFDMAAREFRGPATRTNFPLSPLDANPK
ncbi:hypothetical protein CYMTET_29825 [Cymbomonas tetramitiformis]|uniref:AP2/ERF domain-containing protein n=1 Tax=Cymbomonas tetramitiformis TaxID=36881 RepID=A0AAE0FDE3_9CHLO|nr:hypothetical protein CYMTET_33303 [Cymbomonas tetramitiformis]KAK3261253.1 hypothetical protein CYMTET_29825 [Cymbomonas tetramitiformis]